VAARFRVVSPRAWLVKPTLPSSHCDPSVFAVEREGEKERFKPRKNTQLLWHGSRMTNWCGIFSSGLRIAPPEAPVTGYMFGKGVYFANMISKSAQYCHATPDDPVAVLVLCEVALGEQLPLLDADQNAPERCKAAGKDSVLGVGLVTPDPNETATIKGMLVPWGRETTAAAPPGPNSGYRLQYDEFIVYDEAQIRIRFALKVRFNFAAHQHIPATHFALNATLQHTLQQIAQIRTQVAHHSGPTPPGRRSRAKRKKSKAQATGVGGPAVAAPNTANAQGNK